MKYLGGKTKIAKELTNYLNSIIKIKNQTFIDLFCGSCNIIQYINSENKIANDSHYYLIEMWKALQNGWIPPEFISEEDYKLIKNNYNKYYPALIGFVGFACSFGGKWWGGYARSRQTVRNYCLEGKKNLLKKLPNIKDVKFTNYDYKELIIPENSIIYCDIPYKNTTGYKDTCFNWDEFINWVRINKDKDIYISEYLHNKPDDFEVVWKRESRQDISNKENSKTKTIEILMKIT